MAAINVGPRMENAAPYATAVTTTETVELAETAITTTSTASMTVGDIVKMDGELMTVTTVNANDIVVTRATRGTIEATHANGVTVLLAEKAAGTTTITYNFTVPTGKRWLIGIIEATFGTAATGNTMNIATDFFTTTVFYDIWSQISNQNKMSVEFESKYPRANELEAADVLKLTFVRGTSSTITGVAVHVLESDI